MKVQDDAGAVPALPLAMRIRRSLTAMRWLEAGLAGAGGFLTILALAEARLTLGTVLLIAPFGASCVLVFALPESSLAQPRNVIGGHVISTAIGLMVLSLIGASPSRWRWGSGLPSPPWRSPARCIPRPAPIPSS
jgi:CBS-domain-containing membrane protein